MAKFPWGKIAILFIALAVFTFWIVTYFHLHQPN